MTALEERLRVALLAGAAQVEESPDLFARVKGSIEDETKRRAWRRQVGAVAGVAVAGLLGLIASVTDYQEGELLMTWWILELLTTAVLVTVVIVLGPFIKRFGRSYAAEVFRSNPSTGKSFLVLMDFAYYLIFGAYILFTLVFDRFDDWPQVVGAAQFQFELGKVGGIFLILGILHSANLLMLPIIGRLLTLNRQLDLEMRKQLDRQKPPS